MINHLLHLLCIGKEPTHFSQRVGHRVPSVMVWSLSVVLVGVGNARHISISLLEA